MTSVRDVRQLLAHMAFASRALATSMEAMPTISPILNHSPKRTVPWPRFSRTPTAMMLAVEPITVMFPMNVPPKSIIQ